MLEEEIREISPIMRRRRTGEYEKVDDFFSCFFGRASLAEWKMEEDDS